MSVTFSVVASAEEIDTSGLMLYQYQNFNGANISGASSTFYPNNDTVEKSEKSVEYTTIRDRLWKNNLLIQFENGDILINKGERAHVKVNNLYYSMLVDVKSVDESYTYQEYITRPTSILTTIYYADGTSESITGATFYVRKDKTINIDFQFTTEKDVQRINFVLVRDCTDDIPYYNSVNYVKTLTFYSGEYDGDDKYQVSVDIQSEEVGLLEGILAKITSVADSILELPQKLWNLISDGLKSLFVPSEQYILDFKADMDNLLEDKFGFAYQSITLLDNSLERIVFSDITNTIYLPKTDITLRDITNNEDVVYSFGGYNVKIVPDNFDFMADFCSIIIGIVATLAFANSARKRYVEFLEGAVR